MHKKIVKSRSKSSIGTKACTEKQEVEIDTMRSNGRATNMTGMTGIKECKRTRNLSPLDGMDHIKTTIRNLKNEISSNNYNSYYTEIFKKNFKFKYDLCSPEDIEFLEKVCTNI